MHPIRDNGYIINCHSKCDSEEFFIYKDWFTYLMCDKKYHSPKLEEFFKIPDVKMQESILKSDGSNTTTVSLIKIGNKFYVCKRYNIKGFWHGLKRAFTPSRAAKCWRNAHYLRQIKVNTPAPVAFIEKRFGPFRRQAYFIYEYIAGELLSDLFATTEISPNLTRSAKDFAYQLKVMQNNKIIHGDMKATNFLNLHDEFYFIDLDAMKKYRFDQRKFTYKKTKDINRFLENWPENSEIRNLFKEAFHENSLLPL